MGFVADILLAAGAIAAAVYCHVLSQKLSRFGRLESGLGGAITVLSAQVDDMTGALDRAEAAARDSAARLEASTARGQEVAAQLELLLATMHDLPGASVPASAPRSAEGAARRIRVLRSKPRLEAAE